MPTPMVIFATRRQAAAVELVEYHTAGRPAGNHVVIVTAASKPSPRGQYFTSWHYKGNQSIHEPMLHGHQHCGLIKNQVALREIRWQRHYYKYART